MSTSPTRKDIADQLRKSFLEGEFGGSDVTVTDVTDVAPEDDCGFGTFTIHVGDVDNGPTYHVHVYAEE